jgi:CSLREA domain-containing protein
VLLAVWRRLGWSRRSSMVGVVVVATLATPAIACSATFTVNTQVDAVDVAPGNGACATAAGTCSLRAAVQEADLLPGPDSIDIGSATYTLTRFGAAEDAGLLGDLDLTGDTILTGNGATVTTASGWDDRLLDVHFGTTVQVTGVTFKNGHADSGGAIRNDGTLTLDGGEIAVSTASGPGGGGILNLGTLTLDGTAVTANSATGPGGDGGGIRNSGSLTVDGSLISGNFAAHDGGGIGNDAYGIVSVSDAELRANTAQHDGGGAYAEQPLDLLQPSFSLERTTVDDNTANHDGGGLENAFVNVGTVYCPCAGMTADASTISGNVAHTDGGGVASTADFHATNTTVSSNTASGTAGGILTLNLQLNNATITANLAQGGVGGIFATGGATVLNTIISGNSLLPSGGGAPVASNCSSKISGDYDLVSGDCAPSSATHDVITSNPQLGPLADNGGPTFTHSLATCAVKLCLNNFTLSPAVDRGSPATTGSTACATVDQRGLSRSVDGNGDGVARCDIGAFEWHPPSFLLGTFSLAPEDATVAVQDDLPLSFGWTVPGPSWRVLDTLELRIRDDARTILWVRFHEAAGTPGTLALVDPSTGREGPAFAPGRPNRLETDAARLLLAGTSVAGPPGSHVQLVLDTAFKRRAAGETYEVEVRAIDDGGQVEGWLPAGRVTVEP